MREVIGTLVKAVSSFFSEKSGSAAALERELEHNSNRSSITILCVLRTAAEQHLLEEISHRNHWNMFFASTSEEAHKSLKHAKPQIILIDRDIDGADWRHAVSSLATASSGACVLLISRVIDDYLWNEVVTNGGYDLLRKPLGEDDVLRSVRLAWSYWSGTRLPALRSSSKL